MPQMKVEISEVEVLKELSHNFTDPLELIREAISNAYDAGANNMAISIKKSTWHGESRYVITFRDDGAGMVLDETPPRTECGSISKFFTLGKSPRIDGERDWIGEKGIGIKIAFRSDNVEVRTWAGGDIPMYRVVAEEPWRKLHDDRLPDYACDMIGGEKPPGGSFTEIEVTGFFGNDASRLSADQVEDYISWFTKWGSFEQRIGKHLGKDEAAASLHLGHLRPPPTGVLTLEAPGAVGVRTIPFGHLFPDKGADKISPNESLESAADQLSDLDYDTVVEKLDELKRRHWTYFVRVGQLAQNPDVTWQAIVSVEGASAKRAYNRFLRTTKVPGKFSIKSEERYGLWFCKDFFCVDRANDVAMDVLHKEGQRSRFKILFNSQSFRLNADRTSVGSTEAGILIDLQDAAKTLVAEMIDNPNWEWTEFIEGEVGAVKNEKQDEKTLTERCIQISKKERIMLPEGGELMRVPATEAETVLLAERLAAKFPDKFDFHRPLDWRTERGIDSVVDAGEVAEEFRFAEFKRDLKPGKFNHTFRYLHYIICWDVKAKDGGQLRDTAGKLGKLRRYSQSEYDLPEEAPWTIQIKQKWIQVFALKDILVEKFGATIEPPG